MWRFAGASARAGRAMRKSADTKAAQIFHPPLEGGSKMPEAFSGRGRFLAENHPSPKSFLAPLEGFRPSLRGRVDSCSSGKVSCMFGQSSLFAISLTG